MTRTRVAASLSLAAAGVVLAGCGGGGDPKADAYEHCEQAIQIKLHWPDGDPFAGYDHAIVTDNGGLYKVTGLVNGTDTDGNPKSLDFTCQLRHDDDHWRLLDATF